ncbi:MAG: MmgE/PrpD family protein [Steroidobacteraceae bacterium]
MSGHEKTQGACGILLNRRQFAVASLASGLGLTTAARSATPPSASDAAGAPAKTGKDATDASRLFARHFLDTRFEAVPADVVQITKMEILDSLGIAIAGASQQGVMQVRELVMECAGKPESHLFGGTARVPAHDAGQVNATMVHALDYDDVYEHAFVHPAVVSVPPAFAAAECVGGLNGKDMIAAIALGVDMVCRLAAAARPGVDAFTIGWHNTTLYGYLTSAMVTGKIMGLSEEQMVHACGIAYHQCAGNAQAILDGALTKRMGPGFSVRAGMMAARLAKKGATGATHSLEGIKGLYALYHQGQYDRDVLLRDLGSKFAGSNVSFKPYPSCRGSHPSIDAALALATGHDIKPNDIQEIIATNGPGQYNLLSTPLATKARPRTTVDMQFSVPWTVAVALLNRQVTTQDFTSKAMDNPAILALTSKVKTQLDPSMVAPDGGVEPARVEVVLKNGERFSEQINAARGSPEFPISFEDCARKFTDNAGSAGLSQSKIAEVIKQVAHLEDMPDATALLTLLS